MMMMRKKKKKKKRSASVFTCVPSMVLIPVPADPLNADPDPSASFSPPLWSWLSYCRQGAQREGGVELKANRERERETYLQRLTEWIGAGVWEVSVRLVQGAVQQHLNW